MVKVHAFVLSSVLALLSVGCENAEALDQGLMVREGHYGIVRLHPGCLPVGVAADGSVQDELGIDFLPGAVEWWNEQVGREVFFTATPTPLVTVTIGHIEGDLETPEDLWEGASTGDQTTVRYSLVDGEILGSEVVLSEDLAYDRETMRVAARHGLGHGGLGLADDAGPPKTVDLRSIMASPMDVLGEVTEKDLQIITTFLDCEDRDEEE
jgi:hypothetical protein